MFTTEGYSHSLDELLQELVNFLPYSWQYPEVTCARVLFKGKTYTSDRFKVTGWRQSARIYMYHEPVGEVGIFYFPAIEHVGGEIETLRCYNAFRITEGLT